MKKILITAAVILAAAAVGFASDEIRYVDAAGLDRYCRIVRSSDLKWWDTAAGDWGATPTYGNTAMDLTESANGNLYTADIPDANAGTYMIIVYSGTAAAAADTDDYLWGFDLCWDGTAEVSQADIIADVNTIYIKIMDPNDANSLQADVGEYFDTSTAWLSGLAAIVKAEMKKVIELYQLDHLSSGGIRDRAERKRN